YPSSARIPNFFLAQESTFKVLFYLCYVAVDAFDFHQFSLVPTQHKHWWKWTQLSHFSIFKSLTTNRKLLKANPPLMSVTGDHHGVQCCFLTRCELCYVAVDVCVCLLPLIVFIDIHHSLALVETDLAELCFYMVVGMNGLPTMDTLRSRAAHLHRTAK
ncbi:hypothetical protein SFRURICE_005899, partial [Spodoptera frugiperda]